MDKFKNVVLQAPEHTHNKLNEFGRVQRNRKGRDRRNAVRQ